MPVNYPDGLDEFSDPTGATNLNATLADGRTHSSTHRDLGDAIVAIESELGLNPADTAGTVAARIAAAEASLASLDSAVTGKQPLDADLSTIAGLVPSNDDIMQRKAGAWAASTPATVATDMGVASDSVQTLTNKFLDFDFDTTGNTIDNIPQESVLGLTSALETVGISGMPYVVWDGTAYPARSTSGTVDPAVPVLWIRGPGPSLSGTGSTGAVVGDLWIRAV